MAKLPSIVRTEFSREIEKMEHFKSSLQKNMANQKEVHRKKFAKLKAKYDKAGVEVTEDETEVDEEDMKR